MKIYLIIGNNVNLKDFPFENDSLKIGIDRGSLIAISNNIKLDYAVGDFDSCSEEERNKIYSSVKNVIKLNPIKDDTDTKHAYSMYKDEKDVEFILLGSIAGERIEHFYANLELVMKDERVSLLDDSSLVFMTSKNHEFANIPYKYVSFFPLEEEATISLRGFYYNLDKQTIYKGQGLGISNEIVDKKAHLEIYEGKVLVFLSKNDHSN